MLAMVPIPVGFTGRNQSPRSIGRFGLRGFALASNLPLGPRWVKEISNAFDRLPGKSRNAKKNKSGFEEMGSWVLGALGANVTTTGLFCPQCCLYVGKIKKSGLGWDGGNG